MSLLRTPAGAGIALVIALCLCALVFTGPEPTTVNLTADDCAASERCYR
ncbi:MAG: hypothetical protein QG592_461 [Pseudomonadota bacterium]|nr:hypothetical protein [Pseudomonadota bacterium]